MSIVLLTIKWGFFGWVAWRFLISDPWSWAGPNWLMKVSLGSACLLFWFADLVFDTFPKMARFKGQWFRSGMFIAGLLAVASFLADAHWHPEFLQSRLPQPYDDVGTVILEGTALVVGLIFLGALAYFGVQEYLGRRAADRARR